MTSFLPVRLFHSSTHLRTAAASANKNLLGQLRKATGYTISNCKKALDLHDNDFDEANKWLASRAQAEGWAKATKLAGRSASQGQLGISISQDNTQAAMLEINCETDFVARNSMFVELATELTEACLTAASNAQPTTGTVIKKEQWSKEQVSALQHSDGKTFADKVALSIGLLGENMILKQAMKMCTGSTGVQLYGYTHPGPASNAVAGSQHNSTLLGRYGAVVAVRELTPRPASQHVLKHLCLQVIGMKPECIGTEEEIREYEESIKKPEEPIVAVVVDDALPEEEEAPVIKGKTAMDRFLLKQDWLDDDECTVEQVLQDAGLEILDFVRMEVGQQCEEEN